MLRSSLGFHTLTLFSILMWDDMQKLRAHFKRYSKKTGIIKIFPEETPHILVKKVIKDGIARYENSPNSTYIVDYYQADRGIEWHICYNNWSIEFQFYLVEVTINPKILGGITDYVTAATFDDMDAAITNFNLEAQRISPLLKSFDRYHLKRIDYCINFALEDFMTVPNPELVMELIRRGNIPPHFKEWKRYSETAHRMVSDPASFYLTNKSLHINCYSKYMALKNCSDEREEKGLTAIPQAILDSARGIIRFEVQCKYHKMYSLSNRAEEAGNTKINKYEDLLSNETCHATVSDYFNKVIGRGDWYTLQAAIQKLEAYHFNRQKEKRLVEALQLVNQCRSVAKAKTAFQDSDLKTFKETLKELARLGINPVTIPKEKGVKHIPNLLRAYGDKRSEEKSDRESKAFFDKEVKAYVKEHGWFSD